MPRSLEILLAASALTALSPLFLLISMLIKLESKGPVLFRQERIGCAGRSFLIAKFRTMVTDAEDMGGRLTVGDRDPRITTLGWLLRKFKLDELPQLWNVLRGHMCFVGPRPEVPEYVRLYDEVQRAVLLVPPGITDPASIAFRDENRILAMADDPHRTYVEEIMPQKLAINARYIEERSGWSDFSVIAETVKKAVLKVG